MAVSSKMVKKERLTKTASASQENQAAGLMKTRQRAK